MTLSSQEKLRGETAHQECSEFRIPGVLPNFPELGSLSLGTRRIGGLSGFREGGAIVLVLRSC